MTLQLVVDNWKQYPRQWIIKKLPIIQHNKQDRSVVKLSYSVRSRYGNGLTWYLIRKERWNEKTDFNVPPVNPDSAA